MNLVDQGTQLLEKGDFDGAIKAFSSYLETDALNPNVLCLRGVAYRKVSNHRASLEDFQKAANLIPTNASVYSEMAVTQFHLRDLVGALSNMNKAQELEPENPYRYSSRAYIKDACGDTKGAIADYQKTLELDPQDAVAHNNLGMLEEKLGRIEAAKKHFEKADEISKDEESPFFGKFNSAGEQILDKTAAKQEVEQVMKDAYDRQERLQEEIKIKETPKPTLGKAMLDVFRSKKEFKAFIQFIKRGFKAE